MWEKTGKAKENEVSNYSNWLEEREWEGYPLHFFISSQAFWRDCPNYNIQVGQHNKTAFIPLLFLAHFHCTPPVSLGSRASRAETYLLPCLLIFMCPHFIQEVKDIIFPGQLSQSPSPWLVISQPYLPGTEKWMFKYDFKLYHVPANVNWVVAKLVSSYAPLQNLEN